MLGHGPPRITIVRLGSVVELSAGSAVLSHLAERSKYSVVVLINQLLYELKHQLILTMVKPHLHLATLEVSTGCA